MNAGNLSQTQDSSQWDRLLRNIGVWQGSFTRFSSEGNLLDTVPTVIRLEGLNDNQTMRQTLQYFSSQTGQLTQEKVLEYSSLNRSILFFEEGAFSQGSLQFAPFSEFGAELGFLWGDRRLRLVQLFDPDGHLSQITLIREHRQGTLLHEHPLLTADQLLGTWEGNAVTLYPDWRTPDQYSTQLTVWQEGDRLGQRLTAPQFDFTSFASIQGSSLRFEQGSHPVQVLLMPDGASSTTPCMLPKGHPFFLEAGWLIDQQCRQRMIRRYDERGGWSSLTLITEHRV